VEVMMNCVKCGKESGYQHPCLCARCEYAAVSGYLRFKRLLPAVVYEETEVDKLKAMEE
jgi:hypothetical protein